MEPTKTLAVPWRALRAVLLLVGVVVGAMAIWGPHIGIGSPGSIGFIRAFALLTGLALVGLGAAGPRIPEMYSTTAILLLNTIVALVLVELASAFVLFLIAPRASQASPAESPDPASLSPYFVGRSWAREYWREFGVVARHYRYHPYFLWRMAPFEGKLIRVDSAGLRVTPGATCVSDAYRVWFFGGSTAWGLGAPDDGTIPAHLQRLLAGTWSKPVCVVNFGQLGFTSTQELVQFEWELRSGKQPDLAIFYDGVNDIITAFQYNRAGLHWNLPNIARKLESTRDSLPGGSLHLWHLVTRSNTYRLTQWLSGAAPAATAPHYRGEVYFESDTLADAVVATYLENVRIANALAKAYGFRVAFFWQPNCLVGPKPLTESERAARERERIAGFMRKVYARIPSKVPLVAGLHDLTNIFARDSSLVYLDGGHLTPEGNDTIAQAVARAVSLSDTRTGAPQPAATGRFP